MGELKKIYKFGGLNLRTNELTKPSDAATVAENVELTSRGYLRKRFGYEVHSAESGFIQLIPFVGGNNLLSSRFAADPSLPNSEPRYLIIGVKADGLYGWGNPALPNNPDPNQWSKLSYFGSDTEPTFTEPLSFTEFDGVLYLADPSGTNVLLKHDGGGGYYNAGLPQVESVSISGSSPIPTYFYRLFFEYIDGRNNIIVGDYVELGTTSNNPSISINTLLNTGYLSKTLVYNDVLKPRVRVFVSKNRSFGYRDTDELGQGILVDTSASTMTFSIPTVDVEAATENQIVGSERILLSDIYDYTVRKGEPPKTKYISSYNGLLILANITDVEGGLNVQSNAIRWSDLTTGGSVENFPALNTVPMGQNDKEITGLFGESDNLVVYKDTNIFYLSGDLINGNYRIRDSLIEGIGCVSHQSIIKVEGGAISMSNRGFYLSKDGYKPTEFSDSIEPLFTEGDLILEKAISALDAKSEKIYCFIPSASNDHVVVVYDYYHKVWTLYKGIDATGGFIVKDDILIHSDGTNVYQRNTSYNDNGNPISSVYATSWLNEGYPSLKKKYVSANFFSINRDSFSLTVKSQNNWEDVNKTTTSIQFPSSVGSDDCRLNASQASSCRIIIENAILNEPMVINAIEYEVAMTQKSYKGDD